MPDIQLDMFEVQLGAAILLQFRTEGRVVRILADAGIKASGYQEDHVLRRLLPLLGEGCGGHIDLVMGTHYDEDHLNGLVPIIEHQGITIGEAWMPPVANDSGPPALDAVLTDDDLLPHQFYGDNGAEQLAAYLRAKRADVEMVQILEGKAEMREGDRLSLFRQKILATQVEPLNLREEVAFFGRQLAQFDRDDECDHGTDQEMEAVPEVEEAIAQARRWPGLNTWTWLDEPGLDGQRHLLQRLEKSTPEAAAAQKRSFGNIRKGAAKDAINAIALHRVVAALRKRNIPIRTEIIRDGEPRRYAWDLPGAHFAPALRGGTHPVLTLLGPSTSLVRKHWNRLPVEQATHVALSFLTEIKAITPSNQLSYIARLEHKDQGILISGDAGCVDFKSDRQNYFPKLLKALLPLHVLQVAHHGGNNAHFYRVLEEAGYPAQTERSLLLLSHATQDKHRPSDQFRSFILGALKQGDDVQLLFTSQPQPKRSQDFKHAVHSVVGTAADKGDVQMVFDNGQWRVTRHAVAP